tara:strand:+ start:178 stop:492 length:315 start_codon:yes stop_codon:yes gene_type:complete
LSEPDIDEEMKMELLQNVANEIDRLAQLDKMAKAYAEEVKALKAGIANKYGEGYHKGDLYGVEVRLDPSTTTKWAAVAKEANVAAEIISKYTTHGAKIVVTPKI